MIVPVAALVAVAFSASAAERPVGRHHHHERHAKLPKTHRIIAGTKSIRINDIGEVITPQTP